MYVLYTEIYYVLEYVSFRSKMQKTQNILRNTIYFQKGCLWTA